MPEAAPVVVPVILSGGAGTRLWPVSREGHPKPFMKLPDGRTLLGHTVQRAARAGTAGRILLVTNRDYYFVSKDEVARNLPAGGTTASYLLEPVGRNTGPAAAIAGHVPTRRFPPTSDVGHARASFPQAATGPPLRRSGMVRRRRVWGRSGHRWGVGRGEKTDP